MPKVLFAALAAAILLASPGQAFAHKVVAAVFAEGDMIEGEVGFSDGNPAQPGLKVQILGPDGSRLGEAVTDADGLFRFKPSERVEHTFVIDLGMGHVARAVMPVADLPASLSGETPGPAPAEARTPGETPAAAAPTAAPTDLGPLIDRAVAHQVNPLRRDLAAFKDEVRVRDVLGGIGYILGLTGIGFYVAARRREKPAA